MPSTDDLLSEFTVFAERLADAARRETLPRFRARGAVFNKSDAAFDPVTEADRETERRLRDIIKTAYPGHGVIGEEYGGENIHAEWRWVLDPIDGTRAFVCGVASWSTLIALERQMRPMIGLIDQPFTDERWIGAGGATAYLRGIKRVSCKTSGVKSLREARLSTTDPRSAGYFSESEADAFSELADRSRFVRFSLDAYAYGLLALGEFDLVVESGLQHHDVSALIPVIEGAGGVVSDWRGRSPGEAARGRIVAAATPELHEEAVTLLRRA